MRVYAIRLILIYLFVVYFVFYILYFFLESNIQKFDARVIGIDFDPMFLFWLLVYFFSVFFGFRNYFNTTSYSRDQNMEYSNVKLIFLSLLALITIYWTNQEIISNNYGVLGKGNVESKSRIGGIVVNLREIVVPGLLLTILALKKKSMVLINVVLITLIIYFVYSESLFRYTKSAYLIFLIGGSIAYLPKVKMSIKFILLLTLLVTVYFVISDYITALRFIEVGDVSIDDLAFIEHKSFLDSLIIKLDRFTGFKDFYYAYKLLEWKAYFPSLMPFIENPNSFYSYSLLGVDSTSYHSSAVGFFGFFMLSFGLPFGAVILFLFSLFVNYCFHLHSQIRHAFSYYLFFFSFFFDLLGGVLDGNLKYLIISSSMLFRLGGVFTMVVVLRFFIENRFKNFIYGQGNI